MAILAILTIISISLVKCTRHKASESHIELSRGIYDLFSYLNIIIFALAPPRALSLSRRSLTPRHTQRSLVYTYNNHFSFEKNPFYTSIYTSRSLQILFRDLILVYLK
nr:MAG TPA: hypothetical protein [Caudoviricetes sp.]